MYRSRTLRAGSDDLRCHKRTDRHASCRWAELRKNSRVLLHIVKTEYPDQTPNRASLTRKLSLNIP